MLLSGLMAQMGHAAPQPATLLKEIGQTVDYKSSNPHLFTTLGTSTDAAFFARTDTGNVALFRTDGTPGGTVRMKDFAWGEAAAGQLTGGMVPFGGGVLFTIAGANAAWELWKSDGTAAGTALVKAVPAADGSGFFLGVPTELVVAGSRVFLAAGSMDAGQELWTTDGTAAGTVLVKDIFPGLPEGGGGPNSSYPSGLCAAGGTVFFSANDAGGFARLWKSDGTAAGTVRVEGVEESYPEGMTLSQGLVYFTTLGLGTFGEPPQVYTAKNLWRTDGTAAGTVRLSTFGESERVGGFTEWNGLTVFCRFHRQEASFGGTIQEFPGAFFQTDGTVAGTTQTLSFSSQNSTLSPTGILGVLSGGVLAYTARGDGLFPNYVPRLAVLVPGQGAGELAQGQVSSSVVLGGSLYYNVSGRYTGERFFRYNPALGANALQFFGTMNGVSLRAAGGKLYGMWNGPSTAPVGQEPWRIDALTGVPTLLGDLYPGAQQSITTDGPWTDSSSPFRQPENLHGSLVFLADGSSGLEWWKSDGSTEGTTVLKELVPGPGGHSKNGWPQDAPRIDHGAVRSGGRLFFARTFPAPAINAELWSTDGTEAGTILLREPASLGSYLRPMAQGIYWIDPDYTVAPAKHILWASDGTPGGTRLVKEIGMSDIGGDTVTIGGRTFTVLESATDATRWLWEIHPTAALTQPIYNFAQPEDQSVYVSRMIAWQDKVLIFLGRMLASAPTMTQIELWQYTPGAPAPQRITTLPPDQYAYLPEAAAGRNLVYFDYQAGLDPVSQQVLTTLWVTDGTAAGTRPVAPDTGVRLASTTGVGATFRVVGDRLFTIWNGDAAGLEIWTTDGTATGLRRLTGTNPAHEFLPNGSLPANLTVGGDGWLYYDREVVENDQRVRRIYRVNAANPQAEEAFGDLPENQINVFGGASLPRAMFWAHGRLYASCYTGDSGHEFYWWPAPAAATPFSTWTAAHNLSLGNADPLADPDADGSPNALEFLTGSLPANGGSQAGLAVSAGALGLEARFRLQGGTGLAAVIESSTDCATWTPDLRFGPDGAMTAMPNARVHFTARTGSQPETITLQLPSPGQGAPMLYVRLRAE